jgi:hypothetical protein
MGWSACHQGADDVKEALENSLKRNDGVTSQKIREESAENA